MTEKADRIIVVDDDPELRALLRRYLSEHGYETRAVDGGSALDRELLRNPADAIVLDLMMPGEDGLAITRRLRAGGDMSPIVMLTARGDPVDRILGIETGADDYLAKPFEPRELVARIMSVLRRARIGTGQTKDNVISVGDLTVNVSAMTVTRDETSLNLSSREFALLATLASSAGRPLSRAQLIDRSFERGAEITDRAIDVQVARLRKAIGDDGTLIKTVWGTGYMLVNGDA